MAKTAKGLVEYAKAQLGKPYFYGGFGQLGTKDFYNRMKAQYPKYYEWEYKPEYATQKVHDCNGLVEGYLFCDSPADTTPAYDGNKDLSANGALAKCKVKGPISTIPEVPGVVVFKDGHAGVYIGGGKVIEARGHAYGVVTTNLSERGWTNWGYYPWIEYPEKEEKQESGNALSLRTLRNGDKGDDVRAMQILLEGNGCKGSMSSSAYGSFGGKTADAVKMYQKKVGLTVDGICGPKTWRKLLGVE